MLLRDHLEKVRYFQAVCDAGTFRKAAEQLRLSQSSLTVAVRKLEAAVGDQLLIRTKRGVRPTPAGATLLAFANDLSFRVEDLEARLRAPHDRSAGRLRIGAYDSIAVYWLPRVLRHLRRQFPNLTLSVSVGSSISLIDRVKAGQVDVAIVVAPPADDHLEVATLFRDRFSFFAAKGLAKHRDSVSFSADDYLIGMFGARVVADRTLADVLRTKGVRMTGALEVESFEIAKALAQQGVGIAVLPHRVAEFGATGERKLHRLQDRPLGFGLHDIGIVTLAEPGASGPLAKAVCREMRRVD